MTQTKLKSVTKGWTSGMSKIKYLVFYGLVILLVILMSKANAISRISVSSGNYSSPATWNPSGIPTAADDLTISATHVINVDANASANLLTIAVDGKLTFTPATKLTVHNNLMVYGTAEINEADLDLVTPGSVFTIGATGSLTWAPANNTASGATLFTNGIEFFNPTGTLIIKRWYNYSSVPLGSVVSGNFGNVILNTITNGLLYEWNQDNAFQDHMILGALTIDQGWVVLDKSGSITNTFIGNIKLNNINSYLDIHSGNHPGSFNVTTNSITNIGGKLNGIYNGDGNIHLQVNGNITNLGNIELIYNSGIQGIANGNASMQVTGSFTQNTGDFRGIFNISSTSGGKVNLEFGSLKLTGGIFMGQYSCHTAGNYSVIKINGDLEINFSSANAKFRGNGLTTLSGINNNLSLQLTIDGNLIVKGIPGAEFTSSGSTGPETTIIKGDSRFEGCTSNFNYGSHSTNLTLLGNTEIAGGTVYFSRTSGPLTALLQKNLIIQSGNLSVAGASGNCNLIINGDYEQTGGSMFLHNNNSTPASNIIYTTVYGNFNNQSGAITFDNNPGSIVQHRLSLNGTNVSFGGSAMINTAVSSVDPMYGIIYYDRLGAMQYSQSGSGLQLQNVQQVVNADCNLNIVTGNIQTSSSIKQASDMLLVSGNGILDLNDRQVNANIQNLYSSIMIAEDGRIRISGQNGFYNGSSNASVSAMGNMLFTLHKKSVVEYYGSQSQIVTGTGVGNATTADQQYGILEINKTGKAATLGSNQVVARSGIVLTGGELNLSAYNITLASGEPLALVSNGGYIRSEGNSSGNNCMVKWQNIQQGTHSIPFGISSSKKFPFSFTPLSGFGNEFSISTRSTGPDNRPLTNGVMNLNYNGAEAGNRAIIDRWFHINATGIKADITAAYLGEENTTLPDAAGENFSFIGFTGFYWKLLGGNGNGITNGTGTVSANAINQWGPLLLISNQKLEAADLLIFDAKLSNGNVELEWTATANISPDKYIVERSGDSFQFADVFEKSALPASGLPINYAGTDNNPTSGISYYRLRQQEVAGNIKYSKTVRIDNSSLLASGFEIEGVNPNPFSGSFTASYLVPAAAEVQIKLTGSNGQIVFSQYHQKEEGRNTFDYNDGSKLTPGLYILTITNGTSSKNIKLFHI